MPTKKRTRHGLANLKQNAILKSCPRCKDIEHVTRTVLLKDLFDLQQKERTTYTSYTEGLTLINKLQTEATQNKKTLKLQSKQINQYENTADITKTRLLRSDITERSLVERIQKLELEVIEMKRKYKEHSKCEIETAENNLSIQNEMAVIQNENFQLQERVNRAELNAFETKQQHTRFRAEENEQLLKSKDLAKRWRKHHYRYISPVNPKIRTENQIKRLGCSVQKYMSDRNFSYDQQVDVLIFLATKYDIENKENESPNAVTRWSAERSYTRATNTVGDLTAYISNLSLEEVLPLLPLVLVEAIRTQAMQDYANFMYEHWDLVSCTNLKMTLKLSSRSWELVRKILFYRKDPAFGWVRLRYEGVKVPLPPSDYKLVKWMTAVAVDTYGIQEIHEGYTAVVDLDKSIRRALQFEIGQGFFKWEVDQPTGQQKLLSGLNGTGPMLQVVFDSAGSLKYRKTTALAFKLANGSPSSHKPMFTHTAACSEGGDDQADLLAYLSGPFSDFNRLIKNPEMTVELERGDTTLPLDICAGADQAAVHANYGMGGCHRLKSCPFCDKSNTHFAYHQSEMKEAGIPLATKRSLESIRLLAHTMVGQCPGCMMDIVDKDSVDCVENETPLFQPGMKVPTVPSRFQYLQGIVKKKPSWQDLHLNVTYGSQILLNIEPDKFAICILHLNLRMVGNLLKKSMFMNLRAGDQKTAEKLHSFLVHSGIPIKEVRCTKNTSIIDWYKTISEHSFAGADASRLITVWRQCLEITYDPEKLKKDTRANQRKVQAYYDVWEQYQYIWELLNNLDKHKNDKADELDTLTPKFAKVWREAFGSSGVLYLHLLLDHVSKQLRDFPIDLWFLQTEGLEHCNKIRKQFARMMSNGHKPGADHQRLVEVDSYQNRFGTWVKPHTKKSGPALSYQLLKNTTVWQEVKQLLMAAQPDKPERLLQERKTKVNSKLKFKKETERVAGKWLLENNYAEVG